MIKPNSTTCASSHGVPSAHDKRYQDVIVDAHPQDRSDHPPSDPKAILRQSAEQESRSMSNMLEVMIRDYSSRYTVHGANQQDASRHDSNR